MLQQVDETEHLEDALKNDSWWPLERKEHFPWRVEEAGRLT